MSEPPVAEVIHKDVVDVLSSDEDPGVDESLSDSEREAKRLAKKPPVDHLDSGVAELEDGTVVPLFDVGARIVVERYSFYLRGRPWLDTRVYIVKEIDDDRGQLVCTDEELNHHAIVGFKAPLAKVYLAPPSGNPFSVSNVLSFKKKARKPSVAKERETTKRGGKPTKKGRRVKRK